MLYVEQFLSVKLLHVQFVSKTPRKKALEKTVLTLYHTIPTFNDPEEKAF